MYIESGGQRYALDSVLAQSGALTLLFADTPTEDVDALAAALPDTLRIYAARSEVLLCEYVGYTRAEEIMLNPASRQVMLRLRRGEEASRAD